MITMCILRTCHRLNGPSCQDLDEGQDGPLCRQMCQHDGLLEYVEVGSRRASFLDKAAVLAWWQMCHPCAIMWEADVPPAVGCIAAAPSLAFLDQGLLGHSIWDEVCVYPGLSNLFFLYRIFWEGFMRPLGCCSIG